MPGIIMRNRKTAMHSIKAISGSTNAVNVDGGCYYRSNRYPCMLCAICLETLEEIYPCTLKERFRQQQQKELSYSHSLNEREKDEFDMFWYSTPKFPDEATKNEYIEVWSSMKTDEYREEYLKKVPVERQKLLERMENVDDRNK